MSNNFFQLFQLSRLAVLPNLGISMKCNHINFFITWKILSPVWQNNDIVMGNSMFQTLHSETNFLETNFLNQLILHSFEFIICSNIPHRVIYYQQRRNFPSFNRGCKYFVWNFVMDITKKINLQFNVFTWHLFSCELTIQTKIIY